MRREVELLDLLANLLPDEIGELLGAPAAALDELVCPILCMLAPGLALPDELPRDLLDPLAAHLGEFLPGVHIPLEGFLLCHTCSIQACLQ